MRNEKKKRLIYIGIFIIIVIVCILILLIKTNHINYINAPYQIDESAEGPIEYLEPVFYENENGPTIGVTLDGVIEKNGKYYKDSNNNGKLDDYENWNLDIDKRISDLLTRLTSKQKIGILVNELTMNPNSVSAEEVYDEDGNVILSQLIDITPDAFNMEIQQGEDYSNSTGEILFSKSRSGVMRVTVDGTVNALWNNALNMTCEYDTATTGEVTIPFTVISNPQNEITDAPTSQGFASAVMGDVSNGGDYSLIEKFSSVDREIWNAKGIKRMYGPQIDLITDPRWPRNNTTYTEVPEVIVGITTALVNGYQGGTEGLQSNGVALIVKHFPGDGASYNGFESHIPLGKYRVYQINGSLEKYQLVGFQAAIDANVAGVMPGYSMQVQDGFYGSVDQDYGDVTISSDELGNAYSTTILQTLLRDAMGFEGVVNTDSGVLNSGRDYVMEDYSDEEKFAALINSGCDVISNQMSGYDWNITYRAYNDGLIDTDALNRADKNTLKIMFEQDLFENPYKNVKESTEIVETKTNELQKIADEVNLKSTVLLKNSNNALPLNSTAKTVFIQSFTSECADLEKESDWKEAFEKEGFIIVDTPENADVVFLDVVPGGVVTTNKYVQVLDLVDSLTVNQVDYPYSTEKTGDTIEVTTLKNVDKIKDIADIVHSNAGIVIASIDISSPWILTNLEPYCDGIIASFTTTVDARMEVLTGRYNPTGKLPITLPSCNEVIELIQATDDYGNTYESCVSPNDVPGYDKDKYMEKNVLDKSPSGSYAYQDTDGNIYTAWYGLTY